MSRSIVVKLQFSQFFPGAITARIYDRRSWNVVVKGIRRVWQARFTTVFPIEHPRRARASAQTYLSRDEFGRSFSLSARILLLRETSAISSVGKAVFGFVHIDSHHYGILHPVSKITRNGASQELSLAEDAPVYELQYMSLGCFSQSKFRPCVYNGESRNKKVSNFTVAEGGKLA